MLQFYLQFSCRRLQNEAPRRRRVLCKLVKGNGINCIEIVANTVVGRVLCCESRKFSDPADKCL